MQNEKGIFACSPKKKVEKKENTNHKLSEKKEHKIRFSLSKNSTKHNITGHIHHKSRPHTHNSHNNKYVENRPETILYAHCTLRQRICVCVYRSHIIQ